MHFQPGMAKLIRCARGAIFDVLVDLRRGSPTFGQWEGFELSDEATTRCTARTGSPTASASSARSPTSSTRPRPITPRSSRRGFAYNDPEVGIVWPRDLELFASARDSQAPRLSEIAEELPF